ncbi:MAG TPA: amidase [Bryobacteraceae bacterium]|jgi:aspartyl-tRNA(Asn)/glutamyl-tRNA(Gln) amidotransferase subunit A|nr:amidase [Bryobacteraceae bacterium]
MSFEKFSRRTLLAGAAIAAAPRIAFTASKAGTDPLGWTLAQASDALKKRTVSSEELTKLCLARIHKIDSKLNAFITLQEESALAQAKECDRQRQSGNTFGRLYGIPIALKDNIDTAGVRTTAASNVFKNRVPTEDAEVTRRLKSAGVIFLGKLNLDEMAFAGTGTTGCFGPAHNPWNLDRITGGSSAGSVAAVSTGLCFGSVGSDDGGSVRIPGAYCGVVGFKTSYGRVSTRGVVPSAYSMDTIGPITRTVEDAAMLLQVLAGYDTLDSITLEKTVPDYWPALHAPISSLRVGIPRDYFFEELHPDVSSAVEEAIRLLKPKVRDVRDVTLPRLHVAENGSYDVELYHYQKQFFDKTPELYHPWSQRELERLKTVQTVPYVETLKRIRECRRDIKHTFEQVDILLLPTMREPAPLISETVNRTHKRPHSNTSSFNHFGTPAMTVPCGFSKDGLPIGLQIVGPPYAEPRVLSAGYAYQQATDWHTRTPPAINA